MIGDTDAERAMEHLLVHLTQPEFKLLFAIAFLADGSEEFADEFQLQRYSSPGWEDSFEWTEWLKRGVRYLTFEHGFEFEFLVTEDNGSIHRRGDEIEPRNAVYVLAFRELKLSGQLKGISYLDALKTALSMIEHGRLALPLEMFREAIEMVEQAIEYQNSTVDPEKMKRWTKIQDQALASIGVLRREYVH